MIGLFYPSLHSNPRNPPIKVFICSLITFFGSLLASGYQKERERRSRPKEEHCLMLNLVVEKGAGKDHDQSKLSITRPRTSTPIGFVQRSRLDFGLRTSLYKLDMSFIFLMFLFYCSSFDIISVCISHSHPRCAFILCYRHLFLSSFHHIISIFISINLINSFLF